MGIEGVTASNAATVTGIAMTGVVLDATANTLAAGVAVGNTAGGVSGFIASSTTTVLSILTTIMASGPLGWAMLGIGIIAAVGGEPITENTNKFNMTAYVEWKRVLDAEIEEILCNNYIR